MVASVSFGAYGCAPKEVVPPVAAGQAEKVEGVEISVASFDATGLCRWRQRRVSHAQ